ncbi:DNA adenine methylase (plasmid) [Legionella adelaidensis]|uniref:Site-specific DNA-methyltransferase (adenine-specific) n=1 Tax=Legionella adelaidensis TaxID=45056 RepID=A0A0W0R6C6_9GAMM|nr:DNA adenine methylase [Legionella adelaidensis]VEH85497.1 DNA adenine methylase [Legionella adelaidensis]
MKIRPFLKWAGSKYASLEIILSSFPKAHRYIEPFAGSAAVFLNTHFENNVLAEENADVINLFSFIKTEGQAFINYCEQFFTLKNNNKEQYYLLREEFNVCVELRKRAALFLYLNRHGYNGLCRYNSSGKYNVPFGRYKAPVFPRNALEIFYEKSQNTELKHADFRITFAKAKKGDLIYCDPPYVPLQQTSNFTAYTDKQFGEQEQIMLAELAKDCASRGITVVISNHDTEFTRHYYKEGKILSFPVQRHISCKPSMRKSVSELIAIFAS